MRKLSCQKQEHFLKLLSRLMNYLVKKSFVYMGVAFVGGQKGTFSKDVASGILKQSPQSIVKMGKEEVKETEEVMEEVEEVKETEKVTSKKKNTK